jgi:hypothetical protein
LSGFTSPLLPDLLAFALRLWNLFLRHNCS